MLTEDEHRKLYTIISELYPSIKYTLIGNDASEFYGEEVDHISHVLLRLIKKLNNCELEHVENMRAYIARCISNHLIDCKRRSMSNYHRLRKEGMEVEDLPDESTKPLLGDSREVFLQQLEYKLDGNNRRVARIVRLCGINLEDTKDRKWACTVLGVSRATFNNCISCLKSTAERTQLAKEGMSHAHNESLRETIIASKLYQELNVTDSDLMYGFLDSSQRATIRVMKKSAELHCDERMSIQSTVEIIGELLMTAIHTSKKMDLNFKAVFSFIAEYVNSYPASTLSSAYRESPKNKSRGRKGRQIKNDDSEELSSMFICGFILQCAANNFLAKFLRQDRRFSLDTIVGETNRTMADMLKLNIEISNVSERMYSYAEMRENAALGDVQIVEYMLGLQELAIEHVKVLNLAKAHVHRLTAVRSSGLKLLKKTESQIDSILSEYGDAQRFYESE